MRSSLARRRSSQRRLSAPEPANPRDLRRFVVSPEALQKYGQEADDGLLGSKILFKMKREASGLRGAAGTSLAGAAADVALAIDCGAPSRVFRAAGKFEDAHVASRVEISTPPETNRRDRTSAQVAAGLDLWYAVDCGSEPAPGGLARAAAAGARVDAVEPARARVEDWMPDDPLFSASTADAINLRGAWDATAGSPDVVVQVVDDGVDVAHPDLERNVWTNPGEICGNGVDDDGNGYVDDCHGYNHADDDATLHRAGADHGTHCAGTLAAEGGNGVGVAGVAGGKAPGTGVKLMVSVGFGSANTGGFAEALVYGADMGAQISSNSWGYMESGVYEQALLDAIDYANGKGSLVVFAAGNHAETAKRYPAAYAGAVAVAATDDGGAMASFSNHGGWVDIAAPGVAIESTIGGGRYAPSSGTSMATPYVAGVLALGASLETAAGDRPTRAALLACLSSTARDVDALNAKPGKLGAGLVDAEAFVACAAGDDEEATRDAVAPRQLEIAGVKRMAATGLLSWTSDDDEAFAVAYKTKGADKRWTETSDSFRAYARESDGKYYQALPGVACKEKVMVRVSAASGATAKTSWTKLKC